MKIKIAQVSFFSLTHTKLTNEKRSSITRFPATVKELWEPIGSKPKRDTHKSALWIGP